MRSGLVGRYIELDSGRDRVSALESVGDIAAYAEGYAVCVRDIRTARYVRCVFAAYDIVLLSRFVEEVYVRNIEIKRNGLGLLRLKLYSLKAFELFQREVVAVRSGYGDIKLSDLRSSDRTGVFNVGCYCYRIIGVRRLLTNAYI